MMKLAYVRLGWDDFLAISVSASCGYALAARGLWLVGGAVLVVLAIAITIRTGAGR